MLTRRRMLEDMGDEKITLYYHCGLDRDYYKRFTDMNNRCATSDIPVPAGVTMERHAPEGFNSAVGAWRASDKQNILYGSFDGNDTYTPNVDAIVRIVYKKTSNASFTGNELDGLITVTVGNKTYKS